MQYLIRVICDEVEDFRRDILIDDDATFLDLSHVILKSCGYADDQMTSFYICDEEWERGEQITREDVGDTAQDEDLYVMADTELTTFLDEGVVHMEYVFDPFNDRTFSLIVRDTIVGMGNPQLVKMVGDAPVQIADLDLSDAGLLAGTTVGGGLDFEDFDLETFDTDDIDLDGFEISETREF